MFQRMWIVMLIGIFGMFIILGLTGVEILYLDTWVLVAVVTGAFAPSAFLYHRVINFAFSTQVLTLFRSIRSGLFT